MSMAKQLRKADLDSPAPSKLWRDHVVAVGAFQIFEHAPFFASLQNIIFIPGAVLYAYIHAAAVAWAIFSLNKVVQDSPSSSKLWW